MEFSVHLLMSEFVTHDVKRFILEKPGGFEFEPGHAVELAIDQSQWKHETRPFTPTSSVNDRILEFIIKKYPDHQGVTKMLHQLESGAALKISEPFGTIQYKGPGVFIAGGAGITPFIAILRDLAQKDELSGQTLIFSNKTPADIINEKEFRYLMGERCILTCTQDSVPGYDNSLIDKTFLQEKINDFDQHFYLCGPDGFMESITDALKSLGAHPDALVFEH
ncbi:cytochrome-b5 reductase [Nitrosomonas aestuarii]|uniref:Cytochrome-b5 reductase n=1 Tax=Nitrosomonas aestuarii TaxID=52441 RepID=A0A1I3X824_9PROT|nr:FAD-binding oxidoreductase [Nitrosomonas aestuarii]SFK15467.1 cytochrome-b5 reductase [Nitrosomonas aestuarii]